MDSNTKDFWSIDGISKFPKKIEETIFYSVFKRSYEDSKTKFDYFATHYFNCKDGGFEYFSADVYESNPNAMNFVNSHNQKYKKRYNNVNNVFAYKVKLRNDYKFVYVDIPDNFDGILLRQFSFCAKYTTDENLTIMPKEFKRIFIKQNEVYSVYNSFKDKKITYEKSKLKSILSGILYNSIVITDISYEDIDDALYKVFGNSLFFQKNCDLKNKFKFLVPGKRKTKFQETVSKFDLLLPEIDKSQIPIMFTVDSKNINIPYETRECQTAVSVYQKISEKLLVIRLFYTNEYPPKPKIKSSLFEDLQSEDECASVTEKDGYTLHEYARIYIDENQAYPCYVAKDGSSVRCDVKSIGFWFTTNALKIDDCDKTALGNRFSFVKNISTNLIPYSIILAQKFEFVEHLLKLNYWYLLSDFYGVGNYAARPEYFLFDEKGHLQNTRDSNYEFIKLKNVPRNTSLYDRVGVPIKLIAKFKDINEARYCQGQYYNCSCFYPLVESYKLGIKDWNIYNKLIASDNPYVDLSCISNIAREFPHKVGEINWYRIINLLKITDHDAYSIQDVMHMIVETSNDDDEVVELLKKMYKLKTKDEITTFHDNLTLKYETKRNEKMQTDFNNAIKKYKYLEYSDKNFKIITPNGIEDMVNEGMKMHHCVRSYISTVSNNNTKILFMRKNSSPDTPYLTIEVKENSIIQVKAIYNRGISSTSALDFIHSWIEKKGLSVNSNDIIYRDGKVLPSKIHYAGFFIEDDTPEEYRLLEKQANNF